MKPDVRIDEDGNIIVTFDNKKDAEKALENLQNNTYFKKGLVGKPEIKKIDGNFQFSINVNLNTLEDSDVSDEYKITLLKEQYKELVRGLKGDEDLRKTNPLLQIYSDISNHIDKKLVEKKEEIKLKFYQKSLVFSAEFQLHDDIINRDRRVDRDPQTNEKINMPSQGLEEIAKILKDNPAIKDIDGLKSFLINSPYAPREITEKTLAKNYNISLEGSAENGSIGIDIAWEGERKSHDPDIFVNFNDLKKAIDEGKFDNLPVYVDYNNTGCSGENCNKTIGELVKENYVTDKLTPSIADSAKRGMERSSNFKRP